MFILETTIAVLISFLAVIAYNKVRNRLARANSRKKDLETPPSPIISGWKESKSSPNDNGGESNGASKPDAFEKLEMKTYKELYYKLHNLEYHPEILPQCRELLVSLLSSTISEALSASDKTILTVQDFSYDGLKNFLKAKDDRVTGQYEEYLMRRKNGGPREMFANKAEAQWWLKQAAPVKYVDGAWLGHVNKITTPFYLRNITKNAWQVMSEELGDGDLSKNHVHVYRELMDDIDAGLPPADSKGFINACHELNEARCWKAAMAQLLISLFAHEFLPEALGFNMAYESLPLHLLKTIKELREVKLNPYYFELHICIDNADSGHAAMAMTTVMDYVKMVERDEGTEAASVAWKRVQAGYILAEGLPTTPESPLKVSQKEKTEVSLPGDNIEAALIEIFAAKSSVAHKIHCNSRLKIGRRSLVDWLEPQAFAEKPWQQEFLHDLSSCKPWVIKGSSGKSRLIQELSWEGRMFGSFTQSEVTIVKLWIDSLSTAPKPELPDLQVYYDFTKQASAALSSSASEKPDILTQYPVLSTSYEDFFMHRSVSLEHSRKAESPLALRSLINLRRLLPLWFASSALLEALPSVPVRAADSFGSAIVRVLRAQTGFDTEGVGVAGMDEVRRTDNGQAVGIVELGLEMCDRARVPNPQSLKEAVNMGCSKSIIFAKWMLQISMRWLDYRDVLVGMSWAFMEMHREVAKMEGSAELLTETNRRILGTIAEREQAALRYCKEEIEGVEGRKQDFERGLSIARQAIVACSAV